jgi:hypothetical protein
MPFRPTPILLATACVVGASTVVFPNVTGYGTILFQIIALGAWALVATITSGLYADTHHPVVWCVALVLNLIAYLTPAAGIWLAFRKRWPTSCSIAIFGWCALFLASLFWLFPATDGP